MSEDGLLFHDFATGEAGDAVDFYQRVTGLSQKETYLKFIELGGGSSALPRPTAQPQPTVREKPTFPELRKGTRADFQQLADLRSMGREGLEWASERGVLYFATLRNYSAWVVTDEAGVNAQARRMDGQPWEHIGGAKAWTLPGSWAPWPIGIKEAQGFPAIALCEGGPDFLAAHYIALWEQASHYTRRDCRCAPVAMLGATNRIHEDALPLFAGKRVRIFGHNDAAGEKAAQGWTLQLESVGADVDAVSFDGLRMVNGSPVKDLNDTLLSMDNASFFEIEGMMP